MQATTTGNKTQQAPTIDTSPPSKVCALSSKSKKGIAIAGLIGSIALVIIGAIAIPFTGGLSGILIGAGVAGIAVSSLYVHTETKKISNEIKEKLLGEITQKGLLPGEAIKAAGQRPTPKRFLDQCVQEFLVVADKTVNSFSEDDLIRLTEVLEHVKVYEREHGPGIGFNISEKLKANMDYKKDLWNPLNNLSYKVRESRDTRIDHGSIFNKFLALTGLKKRQDYAGLHTISPT